MTRRQIVLQMRGNEAAEVLMVPWIPQHDADARCFPASLQMVLGFFRDFYSNSVVRDGLPGLKYPEVIDLCGTSAENGTRLTQDLMARISDRVKVLNVSLVSGASFEMLRKQELKNLPTILIYDGRYLLYDLPGPSHAGVYIGQAKNGDPILNNPWMGSLVPFARPKFEVAWELKKRRAVVFQPNPQTELVKEGNSNA